MENRFKVGDKVIANILLDDDEQFESEIIECLKDCNGYKIAGSEDTYSSWNLQLIEDSATIEVNKQRRKSLKKLNNLRDQFAMAALPAVIYVAAKCAVEDTGINPNKLAVDSYRVADAMMAEREKRMNNV